MKKRIACLMLVLVMLVGLIPAAAVPASAASGATSVSEAGVRVIKNYIGFHKNAYETSTGVYKIGYGTDGVQNQTITEANADKLLRDELDTLSATIAASYPNLVQKRFDALVWYSYTEGSTAWMSNSTLSSAISNADTSASALADALCSWDYDQSGYPDDTSALSVLTRRMIIANLYLNGGYSATSTGSLGYTVFYAGDDVNAAFPGGAKKMVQVFAASSVKINVSDPILTGSEFLGWYSGNTMITGVGSSTSGKTLTARWQANGTEKIAANYTLPAYVIYEARSLSDTDTVEVYDSYTTLNKIDEINRDSTITVVAETIYNNAKWLQLSTGGWVKLCDSLSSVPTIIAATTVTITDDYVNVREDPSATAEKVGTLSRNAQVTIAMLSEDGKWGYCSEGWIFLAYTSYDASSTASSTLSGGVSGTVTGATQVNVRSSAGVGNTLVTRLAEGTAVTVYEQVTVDGASWGHIDQGWISMSYVTLNETTQSGSSITTGSSAVVSSSVSLNVRSGPGTSYTKVATLAPGTSVVILRKQTVDGVSWGLIDQGWINLNYVSTVASSSGSTYGVEGTVVNCSSGVNIRSAAGTSNALVGVAALGSRVTVTERVMVNGYYWGHISSGWVCMEYIQLDSEFIDQTTETDELDNVVTSFQGYPAVIEADTPVLSTASATGSTLMTLKANAEVSILALTTSGSQMYGKVTVGTVTGWVDMDDVTLYQLNAKVTSSKADAYELPSTRSTFYASLTKGTYVTIGEGSGTDGWALTDGVLWGQIQLTSSGSKAWIKLSDVTMFKGNVMPTGITSLSGVGYLTGTVTSDAIVYKDSSDTDEGGSGNVTTEPSSYTLTAGSTVNVQARNYNSSTGKTYAKVTVGSVTGWIEWDLIELDPVEMQVTTATTIYGTTTSIPVGTMITITSRSLAYVGGTSGDAEINYGVVDVGTGYIGDNINDIVQVQLDNGKLTPTSTASSESTGNPAIASSVVVSGTASGELSVYEEAIAGSNVLLKVSSGSIVTILNWKNVDGTTWGKVQVNKIVGWVKVDDVSFDGLTGTVNVDSLSVYYTKDKTSAVQILRVNNRSISLSDISFDGTTVWAKMDIDGINGYIDLSNVTLNTPTEESDVNYLTTIAKGKVNSVDATANMDSSTVKSLTKGTEVELAAVKVENGEALWRVKLGSEAGWIKMDCLSMYSTIATITQASAPIYNDLNLIEDDILYTLYRNETVTVLSYRVKDGSLYGEVAYGSTTGWILLCEGETMYVSLTPGSTGTTIGTSSSTTATTATEATTATSTAGYIVCSTTVNVRSSAGIATNNLVTTLTNGTNVNIYETTTVNGKEWARIDQGWVCMDYVRYGTLTTTANGGTNGSSGTVAIVTTVPSGAIAVGYANQDITVRAGCGMGYASVGTIAKNNNVTIYEIKLDGGMSWGRIDSGWICVSYLTITGIGTSGTGTITGVGFTANVRYTASSSGALMAKVMITSKVDVLETTTVGTETWVRTSLGWINGQYVTQDAATIAAIDASTTNTTTSATTATTSGVEEVG